MDYPFTFPKIKGVFLERLNRFVIKAKIENQEVLAYLPNPGRLWELLLKNTELLLVKNKNTTKLPYTVLACKKGNQYILLHTHLTNKIIKALIKERKLDLFKDFEVLEEEPVYNNSRFDLLLKNRKTKEIQYLEIKTCTLFGKEIAMFPDAETKRGTKHLLKLQEISKNGGKTGILFVIMNPDIKYFLPAYHIDLEFTKALLKVKEFVNIKAITLKWDETFSYVTAIKEVEIPFSLLETEAQDKGAYLLVLELKKETHIVISKKNWFLKPGFYVYVGSAMKNLNSRIKRHLRKNKKKRWHIDYLIEKTASIKAIPIRASKKLECEIAQSLSKIAEETVLNFGCSDCNCRTHLFYFSKNPLNEEKFQKLLLFYRIDRLCSYLS